MNNERYIIHIHFSTRPGVCMWVSSVEGEVTTDVTCAFEFTDMSTGLEAVVRASNVESSRTGAQDLMVAATRDALEDAAMPKALQRIV